MSSVRPVSAVGLPPMPDPIRFAAQLARAVDTIRNSSDADWQVTIAPLADLCSQRSATIRLADNALTVEGAAVPDEMSFVADLVQQMNIHDVGSIHLAHSAAPGELLELAEMLALPAPSANRPILVDVRLVAIEIERFAAERRALSVSSVNPAALRVVPAAPVAAPAKEWRAQRASGRVPLPMLEKLLHRLKKGAARDPFEALGLAAEGIRDAMESGRQQEAAESLAALIREEKTLPESDATQGDLRQSDLRRAYGVQLQALFNRSILRALGWMLLDPLYHDDVMDVMHRAGAAATEHLLGLLIEAPTFAQRKALLDALRTLEEGKEQLVRLLDHQEWYVVRNVADLAGELGVEAAVDRLGEALGHSDPRVRKSAGVALARIGVPAAGKYVRKALRDVDPEVRLAVAQAIEGKKFAPLGSALTAVIDTETDAEVQEEFYRALGRIGTPELVQFLQKTVEAGGLLGGRKPASVRIAATQGLSLAGGEAARNVLRDLLKDSDKDVKAEARRALDQPIARTTTARAK